MDEYEAEFVRLSQYVLELVAHDASCNKRFRFGLNWDIVAQSANVFDELVEKACALEDTLGEEPKVVATSTTKWSSEATSGSGQKGKKGHFGRFGQRVAIGSGEVRQAARAKTGTGDQGRTTRILCEHCNRRHLGECGRMTSAYFACGSMKHHVSDYPRRAVVVRDQPFAAATIVVAILALARGRGHGRGGGGRGVG